MVYVAHLATGGAGHVLPSVGLVPPRLKGRLPNDVEDPRVADDDGEAGQDEGHHEEELLGRAAVVVGQDGAGPDLAVQPELAPGVEPRGRQGPETAGPRTGHHQAEVSSSV